MKSNSKSIFFILIFTTVIALLSVRCKDNQSEKYIDYTITNDSLKFSDSDFVGTETCIACHSEEHELWQGSHHDDAMKIADSTSVLADFNNTTFFNRNVKSTFFKKDGNYYVNLENPDGELQDYKIMYTFGVEPLQQYIVEFPNGAFQCLQTAWDTEKEEWFDLQPDLTLRSDEWIHWSSGGMRWNSACADCHSTNLKKNYNNETNTFNTTFDIINVSCEACHGPSSKHVDFYNQETVKDLTPPKMYMSSGMSSKELVDKCARCHSRRSQLTPYFDYDGDFEDHYLPEVLSHPRYERDGQILDEDYVYGSFIQSKMYHSEVSCKDCHNMHSLKLKETGNALCINCHLPELYDTPNHHFHDVDTEQSQCINCHMTGRTYMGNDFRRDHSFRVPRPDQSMAYGTPNACNGCHTEKDAKWASDIITDKFGPDRPDHYSNHLTKGMIGDYEALRTLFKDETYPALTRASALDMYSRDPLNEQLLNELIPLLQDEAPLVRFHTISAFERGEGTYFTNQIYPFLSDSIRMVRIAAARYYHYKKIELVEDEAYNRAQKELREYLEVNTDFPGGQVQLALYHQTKNEMDLAIKAYQKSISYDYFFNQAKMNLALIYYQEGDLDSAEELYLKVTEIEPEYGYSYYMLGLLYNEKGDVKNAKKYLKLASEKEPRTPNSFYNYSLVLQGDKDFNESIKVVDNGLSYFPNNERLLYVKVIGLINLNKKIEAMEACQELILIDPNNQNYLQIYKSLLQ